MVREDLGDRHRCACRGQVDVGHSDIKLTAWLGNEDNFVSIEDLHTRLDTLGGQ